MADNLSAGQTKFKGPHHPLYCHEIEKLAYNEDNSLTCPHSQAAGVALQLAVDYSIAILLLELANEEGWQPN